MYRTKQEVDRHVTGVLARIKDEKERNARGYQIAKLYYEAKEYEIARRYLSGFLSIRENLPQAHKLMGLIHEACGQNAQAIASFKRSLELDDKQKDVVYKICEQYSKSNVDPEKAKFWAERGERLFPNNEVVFKLKEMAMVDQGRDNFDEMERLFSDELAKRPSDVDMRIRLMKLYRSKSRWKEVYDHVRAIEQSLAYLDSVPWVEFVIDVYEKAEGKLGLKDDVGFLTHKLFALCNWAYLNMQHRNVMETSEALHKLDVCLFEMTQQNRHSAEFQAFVREMKGQFLFLSGTQLLKLAKSNQLVWKDATGMAAACYIVSLQFTPLNASSEWFVRAPSNCLKINNRLHKISYFRYSQTGHMIKLMSRSDRHSWSDGIRQRYCNDQGVNKLYDTLFSIRPLKTPATSFLIQSKCFTEVRVTLPSVDELAEYDSVAHLMCPDSLHHLVWMALQHYSWKDLTQPAYDFNIFSALQYSTSTVHNASPETLCQLDVETFLYATVRCTASQLAEGRQILPYDANQPELLPAVLCKPLCTKQQAEWWQSAYKLYSNTAKDGFPKMRLILQRGLETVRLIGNHGMSVTLIIHLVKTMEERISDLRAKLDKESAAANQLPALEIRTTHYWEKALDLLHKLEGKQALRSPQERLFIENNDKSLTMAEIKQLISDGEFFLGSMLMKNQEFEKALAAFEKIEQPFASYRAAQIYRQLALDEVKNKTRGEITLDLRTKYEALLIKSRDAFYLTLDRLRGDKNHELNKLLSRDLDDIETKLSRADTQDGILNESDYLSVNSEDFESPMGITGVHAIQPSTPARTPYLAQSTPVIKPAFRSSLAAGLEEETARLSISEVREPLRVRPSPERLEAQMRALTFSQETVLKTIVDRNEELVRNNREIMDELKETRNLNKQLQDQLSQLTHSRLLGGSPYIPGALNQSLPAQTSPYMVGSGLQPGGFPYGPQPGWMPQYGYQMPSPGPGLRLPTANRLGPRHPINQGDFYSGAAYSFAPTDGEEDVLVREDLEDEDVYNVGGEYFMDEISQPYYLQDIQEWPYGNRASMEGKSTITYQPNLPRPTVPQPGLVTAGLRGQALQYSYRQPAPPAIPGPGYFSSPQTHASVYPSNSAPQPSVARPQPASSCIQVQSQSLPTNVIASPNSAIRPSIPVVSKQPQGIAKPISPAVSVQPAANQQSTMNLQQPTVQQPQVSKDEQLQAAMESITLLFSGKAVISKSKGVPEVCDIKIYFASMNSMIGFHAVNAAGACVVNTSYTPDVILRPHPSRPNVFVWIRQEETIFIQLTDSNECAGFKLAMERVRLIMHKKQAIIEAASAEGQAKVAGQRTNLFGSPQTPGQESSMATPPTAPEASTSESSKSLFGGFSFKTSPVIAQPTCTTVAEQPKGIATVSQPAAVAKPAPKPFEGFSFSLGGSTAAQPSPNPSLLAAPNTKPIGSLVTPQLTRSPGQVSAGAVPKESPGRRDTDHIDEYEPNVDFQPVIPLPDLVEVKTGEEEEEKMFSERCRLFRFDQELKQWKERGIGDMKILKHLRSNRTRIIMRRDQVLKLCANHYINSEMKLSPMTGSDKSWCWNAVDYSDEEVKNEQLAVRFKTAEIAQRFKTVFEGCVKDVAPETEVKSPEKENKAVAPTSKPVQVTKELQKTDNRSLLEMFKPAEGSWECSGCFITSAAMVLKCPACGTLKPGVKPEDVKEAPAAFGTSGAGGFKFGNAASGFSFTSSSTSPATGFTFGSQSKSADLSTKTVPDKSIFFGTPGDGPAVSVAVVNQTSTQSGLFSTAATKEPIKVTVPDKKDDKSKPLSELFKKPEGTWTCSVCMIDNASTILKCAACANLKPGVKAEDIKTDISTGSFTFGSSSGFTFGNTTGPASSGFNFGTSDTSKSSSTSSVFGSATTTEKSGFVFSSTETSTSSTEKPSLGFGTTEKPAAATEKSGFSFAVPQGSSSFSFGSSSNTESSTEKSGFSFPTSTEKTSGFAFDLSKSGETNKPAQGTSLKDLLQSDTPSKTFSPPLSEALSKTETSSIFGQSTTPSKPPDDSTSSTAISAAAPSSSFAFGSSLAKFTFSGVAPSTPNAAPKPAVVASPKSPEIDDHGHYLNKDGEDSHIHFEPVVNLPDKVEVKTGEEGEDVLFENRAKLYRFVKTEWKERGLGVIKLLQHKENKRVRILMRRDQILKICCNHHVTSEMELKPMAKSEGKAWVWFAVDFADEEYKHEQFAIRFKTPEIANKFKSGFDIGKNVAEKLSPLKSPLESKTSPAPPSSSQSGITNATRKLFDEPKGKVEYDDVIIVNEEKATPEQVALARKYQLPDNFYLYESRPPCPGCIGCVDGDVSQLAELLKKSPKPQKQKTPQKSESEKTVSSPIGLFGSVKQTESEKTISSPGGLFGSLTLKQTESAPSAGIFGNTSNTVSFAALAQNSDSAFKGKQDPNSPFSWSGAGTKLFGAGSTGKDAGDHGDDEVAPSNDIHFEPIVSLPEVQVKTGEEDDEVLFCQRSKLFRFDKDSGAWKERGVGDIKILRHKITGVYRVLQRRSQVLKISCNHLLTPNLSLMPMSTSETSWCWTAQDFADEEPKIEQFALKFKNKELANAFRDKFVECQELQRQQAKEEEEKTGVSASKKEESLKGSNPSEEKEIDEAEDDDDDEYEDIDDEDDDDDDDDDEDSEEVIETIFEKRATLFCSEDGKSKMLGMGDLKVLYDDDVTGHRISMETDDQAKICNHIITKENSVSSDGKKSCEWMAVDFSTDEPIRRHFKAQFSSTPALEEFLTHFEKGRQLAIESDISERETNTFPREITRPEVVCSPEGKHSQSAEASPFGGFAPDSIVDVTNVLAKQSSETLSECVSSPNATLPSGNTHTSKGFCSNNTHVRSSASNNSSLCSNNTHIRSSASNNSSLCSNNTHIRSSASNNSSLCSNNTHIRSSASNNSSLCSNNAHIRSSASNNSSLCSNNAHKRSNVSQSTSSCSDNVQIRTSVINQTSMGQTPNVNQIDTTPYTDTLTLSGQSNQPQLNPYLGGAGESTNEIPSGLLGSCSPEISAALEELLKNESVDEKLEYSYLD